jgi:hypothetical protein
MADGEVGPPLSFGLSAFYVIVIAQVNGHALTYLTFQWLVVKDFRTKKGI